MNYPLFQRIITRRWWVVVVAIIVGLAAALVYAGRQERLYQASATVFAHPAGTVSTPADLNSDIGLLSYGTIAETFASLAGSHLMLSQAGNDVGVSGSALHHYSVAAATIPQTTVLQVSVDGPDPRLDARLADALVSRVAAATQNYFRTIALTPLDAATVPSGAIQPQTSHDLLYGGLAGLLIGFLLAALSVYETTPAPAPAAGARMDYADLAPAARAHAENGVPVP
jgi:capsular polysaccharide biosynthesis protein